MFQNTRAFSSFSTDDPAKAKAFYEEILGLQVKEYPEMGGMLELHLKGDMTILVYPKGADHQAATFTVLNFVVDDVEKAVDVLVEKGVSMERYEGFEQDERGISRGQGPAMAWFKDPAGNILSVLTEN